MSQRTAHNGRAQTGTRRAAVAAAETHWEFSGGKYLRRNHSFSAMKAPRGRLSVVVPAAFLRGELTLMCESAEHLSRYAAARPLIPNLTAPT